MCEIRVYDRQGQEFFFQVFLRYTNRPGCHGKISSTADHKQEVTKSLQETCVLKVNDIKGKKTTTDNSIVVLTATAIIHYNNNISEYVKYLMFVKETIRHDWRNNDPQNKGFTKKILKNLVIKNLNCSNTTESAHWLKCVCIYRCKPAKAAIYYSA